MAAFDPDAYLAGGSTATVAAPIAPTPVAAQPAGFDPDAYLAGDSTAPVPAKPAVFDPGAYLAANPVRRIVRPNLEDIPEFRAAPEKGTLTRIRESLSPLIGPTDSQRLDRAAKTQGLLNSLPGLTNALEQAPKNKAITEGFVPALFTPNIKILPTDEVKDGVRQVSSVPMLDALASPNQEGDPTSLRVARAFYNPIASGVNSLASPGSLMTFGIGGELNAVAKTGGAAGKLATGLNRAVIGGFSADMARNAAEKAPGVYDQIASPTASGTDKLRSIVELAIPLTMAGLGSRALYKDIQVGGPRGKMILDTIRKTKEFSNFQGSDVELIDAVKAKLASDAARNVSPGTERNVTPGASDLGNLPRIGDPILSDTGAVLGEIQPRKLLQIKPVQEALESGGLPTPIEGPASSPELGKQPVSETTINPVETINLVASLGPEQFFQWSREQPQGTTGVSYEVGVASIGNPELIDQIKVKRDAAKAEFDQALADLKTATGPARARAADIASTLAVKHQFFNEAIHAAENTGSAVGAPGIAEAHLAHASRQPFLDTAPAAPADQFISGAGDARNGLTIITDANGNILRGEPTTATTTIGEPNATSTRIGQQSLSDLGQYPQANEGRLSATSGSGRLAEIGEQGEAQALQEKISYLNELLQSGKITNEEFLQQSDEAMAIAQQRVTLSPPAIIPIPTAPATSSPSAIAVGRPPFNRSNNPYGIIPAPPTPPAITTAGQGGAGGQPPVPPTGALAVPPAAPTPPPASTKVPLTAFPGTLERAYMDLKTKLVDSTAPIETLKTRFEKGYGYELPPTQDIVNAHDRVFASRGITQMFLKDSGFMKLIQEIPDVDAYGKYLIDRRALELDAAGVTKTGVDLAAARQNVAANQAQYQGLDQQVRDFSQALLGKSVEYGLISPETAATLAEIYPDYVPFERTFDELEQATKRSGTGRGPSNLSRQTVVRKLEGSERGIKNPLGSFLKRAEDMTIQGERNKAAEMLAGYRTLPGWDELIKEVPTSTHNSPHTFSYLDAGVKRTFATTIEIAEAAKALNVQQLGLLGKIVAVPMRLAKLGITGVNPAFVLRNLPRDQQTVFINSRNPIQALTAIPRAIFEAVGHGALYDQMMREGAIHTSFDIARDNPLPNLEKIRSEKNLKNRVIYTAKHPVEWLRTVEDILNRGEEMTRIQQFIAAYDAGIKSGRTPQDSVITAAKAARENSANFMRKGGLGPVMDAMILYLRAGIQGSRATVRAFHRNPTATTVKVAAGIMLPTALLTAWNMGDEKRKRAYADIQKSERENNYIFVPPDPVMDEKGQWNVIKLPKPPGVANFSTLIQRPMEEAADLDPVKFMEMVDALIGTVSPIQPSAQSLTSNAIPQIVRPATEIALNKNFFTGSQIVPDNLLRFSPERQYDRTTSGTSIWLGQQLGVSPKNIDHAIKGYFGGLGPQVQNNLDQAIATISGDKEWQAGTRSAFEDISRSFTKSQGGANLKRFYDAQTAADQAINTYRQYERDGDFAQADKFYAEHGKEIDNAHFLSAMRTQLQKINAQINDAEASGDTALTAELRAQKAEVAGDAYRELVDRSK